MAGERKNNDSATEFEPISTNRLASASETYDLPGLVIFLNTAAFALCFAVWVIFGPSMRAIAAELHIPLAMATLIKTLPILIGSAMRIPVGILTDRIGSRLMFPALMLLTAGSAYGLSVAASPRQMAIGSLVMGMVGATFVVGVQSVSSWTPRKKQGVALGIFGAGNVGTAMTTFGLPLLMASFGWRGAFRVYAAAMAAGAVVYWLAIRNAPRTGIQGRRENPLAPLKNAQTWRFGLYYMATFGVFVATTLTITDIYVDSYRMSLKTAGLLATTFTFSASLCRIPGGKLADRFGAAPVVEGSLIAAAYGLTLVCFHPSLLITVMLVFASGVAMGLGMAGVFRYIPDYFPEKVGAVGGLVGALGGLGGFFLPQIGSILKQAFGNPFLQAIPLAALPLIAAVVQHLAVKQRMPARTPMDAAAPSSR